MGQTDQVFSSKGEKQVHYGWFIAFTGLAVLFSSLGLGRFSLGMLLPSMSISLDLNYSQMGLIGTGNFVGYMISVVLAGMIATAIGARWTIAMGLVLVGGSMILISQAMGFLEIMALYVATGIGSGLANVPMMGLVSHWFSKNNRGRAAGVMLSGNGVAIVFTGLFIPWVNASNEAEGWRTGWLTIGAISLLIAAVAAFFIRNEPEEKGLTPLGEVDAVPIPSESDPIKRRIPIDGPLCIWGAYMPFLGQPMWSMPPLLSQPWSMNAVLVKIQQVYSGRLWEVFQFFPAPCSDGYRIGWGGKKG